MGDAAASMGLVRWEGTWGGIQEITRLLAWGPREAESQVVCGQ
jgi:hypothetical protein